MSHRLSPRLVVVAAAALVGLPARPALPDAAQIDDPPTVLVTLANGQSFTGRQQERRRRIRVYETALGKRTVPTAEVVAERSPTIRQSIWDREEQEAGDDLDAVARAARRWLSDGNTLGFARAVERLLSADPTDARAWRLIRRCAPDYEPCPRRNPHPDPGSNRWQRARVDQLYAAARGASLARRAVILAHLESLPISLQLNQAIRALERGREGERWVAAFALRRSDDVRRVRPLYRAALTDAKWQIRRIAVDSIKSRDRGNSVGPFLAALRKGKSDFLRMTAAEAMGWLGDRRAIGPLIHALQSVGRTAPHNHNSGVNQIAYVKDYDVEVAQTAFIADPVVDVVQDGYVHEVAVIALTTQRATLARALSRLTGRDLGTDGGAWARWWNARAE